MEAMEERGIDGVVLRLNANVYYLSGFAPSGLNGSLFEQDESYGVVFASRHHPDHPIALVPLLNLGYFLYRPTWIEDIRSFNTRGGWGATMPLNDDGDSNQSEKDFRRYVPRDARTTPWGMRALKQHTPDFFEACRRAMRDLGMDRGTIGFDDLRFAGALAPASAKTVDALSFMRYVREIKTDEEVALIRRSIAINQAGIEGAVGAWQAGMTWNDIVHVYHRGVLDRGGFVRDHGASVINNDPTGEALYCGLSEDFLLVGGTNVLFDFHGTANHYCWDGGKTWVIGDGMEPEAFRIHKACVQVKDWLKDSMRPGANLADLQSKSLDMLRKSDLRGRENAFITFHGMGLSHVEQAGRFGSKPVDRKLESGMVEAIHIWYPGDVRHRVYIEDVMVIGERGGDSLYEWSFEPLVSSA